MAKFIVDEGEYVVVPLKTGLSFKAYVEAAVADVKYVDAAVDDVKYVDDAVAVVKYGELRKLTLAKSIVDDAEYVVVPLKTGLLFNAYVEDAVDDVKYVDAAFEMVKYVEDKSADVKYVDAAVAAVR